ncbi:MAG: hypothetical protein JSW27_04055 [Phycisphaerales bacterium]|nr:MAG: hypothetical protein JSW27_04055 [Phycisphaerales bacterium]
MRSLALILVLSVLVATPALADLYGTVDVVYNGYAPQTGVVIYTYTMPLITDGGVAHLELSNVTGVPVWWESYLTGSVDSFCIDVADYTPPIGRVVEYDVVSLNSAPDPWAGPMGEIRARYLAELLDENWSSSLTAVEAAALQLAIWEVVDESHVSVADPKLAATGLDIRQGNFYADATAAILDTAQAMLDAIGDGVDYAGKYVALSNDDLQTSKGQMGLYQDWVVRVPVPTAVWLGVLGLSAAGLKLRKRL